MALDSLAVSLRTRYRVVGEIDDLNRAVELGRKALSLCSQGRQDRSTYLYKLSSYLSVRYRRLGDIDDITEAIVLAKDALLLCPVGHRHRAVALNALAFSLCARYDIFWEIEDLDEAIKFTREALAVCTPGDSHRRMYLKNLASYFCMRYDRFEELDNLNDAIVLARDALSLLPPGRPDLQESSDTLASYFFNRYNRFGGIDDLNEAIVLIRDTLSLCPPGHPDRPMSLHNLAFSLGIRFEQLGELKDLTEATTLARGALSLCPQGHSDRLTFLGSLSSFLRTGWKWFGRIDHLNEAIVLATDTLPLCPQGNLDRLAFLNNISLSLRARYEQLGEIDDLNSAIGHARDALSLCPPGHPNRSASLDNLSFYLHAQFKQLSRINDLKQAIVLSREALSLCPPGHLGRSTPLMNLASYLSSQNTQLGEIDDLNEAIVLFREALSLCPPGHPDRSRSVNDLANGLFSRYTQLKDRGDLHAATEDKEALFRLYAGLEHASNATSSQDLSTAKAWVTTAEKLHHPTTLLAYETALRLLVEHLAALPSLPRHPILLKSLSSLLAVDAFSACLRNQSPAKAVELLEQGRAVSWSQLTRLRSPLDDIITPGSQGKALADEFTRLTSLIRHILNSAGPAQHDRVYRLNLELQKVISEIRELPGLSRFLLPSPFSDLQRAARDGPVIIMNASGYSCDALVVLSVQDPIHIPLPVTKENVRELSSRLHALTRGEKSINTEKELVVFLRELWDKVVVHIVGILETICSRNSRIWWCPTAEFSHLPLHAAAPYRPDEKGISDLYVSSYTATLTALIRARQAGLPDSAGEKKCFMAIGQAAPGQPFSVGTELDNVGQLVQDHARFTRIEGEDSWATDDLGKNEWIHFACRGDANQAQSDSWLTIQRIIQCAPRNPEFAYLSASDPTVGDKENPDEATYLAAAMQFAGFRSVVGTMWEADDSPTSKVIDSFYKLMIDDSGRLDYTRAARALQMTMKNVDIPIDQRVLYVHFGA